MCSDIGVEGRKKKGKKVKKNQMPNEKLCSGNDRAQCRVYLESRGSKNNAVWTKK